MMHTDTSSTSRLLAGATLVAALSLFTGPLVAEEKVTGSEIPANAYYGEKLTPAERQGIAEEEDVSPNDGSASRPAPEDRGIIPEPAEVSPGGETAAPPEGTSPKQTAESEADVILDDAKKNAPVTAGDMARCLSDWDPQTQMTKEEWSNSCRSTLPYYPEESN